VHSGKAARMEALGAASLRCGFWYVNDGFGPRHKGTGGRWRRAWVGNGGIGTLEKMTRAWSFGGMGTVELDTKESNRGGRGI
jgi:hypothetical protein